MQKLLDVLASGIHDSKNQLFLAESLVAAHESQCHADLGEVRLAIENAAARLTRSLVAYRLLRDGAQLAIVPVIVSDLLDEVALAQGPHLAKQQLALVVDCPVPDAWPLDRDLIADLLNNAVQNACRYARQQIRLSATLDGDTLRLRVDDDGVGFAQLPPASGLGLLLAERIVSLHQHRERHGQLRLGNDGPLGGAWLEIELPT